ncbi:MAG: hypothetical protein ACXVLQ_12535 [Bacteriovorax sp.]
MKLILIIFVLSLQAQTLMGAEIRKRAVVRDEHFHAVIQEVELPNLTSDNSYEGKFFKIVNGKSNEAIRFDDSEELQLKAATTYYHLNRARKYFTDVVKSPYVQQMSQLTVRVELKNVFNELGHFANDNLDPQYNNALTVPSGKGYEPKNITPWGVEIWFRPSKEIDIRNFKGIVDYGGDVKQSLEEFRNQTHMTNLEYFFTTILRAGIYQGSIPVADVMRLVGSSVILEAIYQSSDLAAEFFSRKIYRLDSALVPEIIYHEFSHAALSDHLELSHSTPVNEGLADYFAGKISNSKKLATKIKDYNLFSGKTVKKKQQYRASFERGEFANADFVFGLLWNVGQTVGPDIEPRFMWEMTKGLSTNVSIRDDLINATLNTCKEFCKDPMNDRIRLYKLYNSKNI